MELKSYNQNAHAHFTNGHYVLGEQRSMASFIAHWPRGSYLYPICPIRLTCHIFSHRIIIGDGIFDIILTEFRLKFIFIRSFTVGLYALWSNKNISWHFMMTLMRCGTGLNGGNCLCNSLLNASSGHTLRCGRLQLIQMGHSEQMALFCTSMQMFKHSVLLFKFIP